MAKQHASMTDGASSHPPSAGIALPSSTLFGSAATTFLSTHVNRVALAVIAALSLLAMSADLLSADKPLYLELAGETYVLPSLTAPAALRIYDNQMLIEAMGPDDFAVLPLVPYGYNTHDLNAILQGPSSAHWLGTDESGRDVLARMIHGSRVSLLVGFLSVLVLTAVGVLLGTLAGYFGGLTDFVVNRVVETIVAVPPLLIIVVIFNIWLPQRWQAILAMSVVIAGLRWTSVARLIRGEILRVKTLEYVDAARVLGASPFRVIWFHVLPNTFAPVLVAATFATGSAILTESALSFLGFGIPDDMASWGSLLRGVRYVHEAWWLGIFPGSAIFLTVTAFNLAGEGLRDAVDPRL